MSRRRRWPTTTRRRWRAIETLESLRRRLRSARELHDVVSTMKSLAAVNIRRYQRAVETVQEYAETIELGMQVVLRAEPGLAATPAEEDPSSRVVVVYGSDQGLCGPINRHVARHAADAVGAVRTEPPEPWVIAVGLRLVHELERVGLTPDASFRHPSSTAAISGHVQDLLVRLDRFREEHPVDGILLVHAHPLQHRTSAYDVVTTRLWPLDRTWLADLAERPWPTHVLPTYRADLRTVFADLVRQELFVTLFRADAGSLAAIEASRLSSMQAAESNIEDRIDALQRRYHQHRQAAITEELLDVVSGFETLQPTEARA
jgi:F-type H+-transporting ATPase subunit gamma